MPTIKQEKALEKIVENGGNVSQAMRDVGYSDNTAKTPQKLTESLGFIELCEEKGLTDNFLIDALIEDIKNKKGNRKSEIELGFKIKGRLTQKDIIEENKRLTGIRVVFDRSFGESQLKEEEKEKLRNLIDK
jgi:hypothetical protein